MVCLYEVIHRDARPSSRPPRPASPVPSFLPLIVSFPVRFEPLLITPVYPARYQSWSRYTHPPSTRRHNGSPVYGQKWQRREIVGGRTILCEVQGGEETQGTTYPRDSLIQQLGWIM